METVRRFIQNEQGATAIEYGLIAALISVAAIAAMKSTGVQLGALFGTIKASMR